MLLLLSGEGASDIGGMTRGADGAEAFEPGPLALIIDSIVENSLNYSPIDLGYVKHLTRPGLAAMAKTMSPRPRFVLPGAKRPNGNTADYRQAFALAAFAQKIEQTEGDVVIAVLFRDSDGTRSNDSRKWENLAEAVECAFASSGFKRGVAMIAKPKQEAWFLCALKENPYQHCSALENESGNDNSPDSLKRKIAEKLGCEGDREALVEWIDGGGFEHARVDMPSFNRFRDSLNRALAA